MLNFRLWLNRLIHDTVQSSKLTVEVRLVLQVVDLLNELVFDLVGDVQLLKALANLQLQVVIGLLYLSDVHLLQLKFTVR